MPRPLRYPTPELLGEAIGAYFEEIERTGGRPTMRDLARHPLPVKKTRARAA